MFDWLNWSDVCNNMLSNLLWAVIVSAPFVLFWSYLKPKIQRLIGITDNNIPILSFETKNYNKDGDYSSQVVIENHGKEPAYNVYVYLYNHYWEQKTASIQPLGRQGVKIGVLSEGKKEIFERRQIIFGSCNITAEQEVWVEYDNMAGAHLRTRILPSNARGDDQKVCPPKYIKKRLEMIPADHFDFNDKERKKLVKGQRGLFPRNNSLTRMMRNIRNMISRTLTKI